MKTDVIRVTNDENKTELAIEEAEKVAAYKKLSHKSALHLRLLAEEAMNMMRSIASDAEGFFWIEDNDGVFELHLKVTTSVDEKQRKLLLSASKSGKNEAARGIMGKIRSFFEPVDGMPAFFDVSMFDSPNWEYSDMMWSMRRYQEQVKTYMQENRAGAAEAWDELEKSVVSNLADDVKVGILGRDVEMIIYKKLA